MNDYEVVGNENFFAEVYKKGAWVGQILDNGRKLFKETIEGLELHGGCPILIPYGDLVKDAKYSFSNKTYHLPKNAYSVNNFKDSIHGITRTQEWSVVERGEEYISLETEVDDTGYPSRLYVNIVYKIKERSFDTNFKVSNVGEINAPIVIGAHPYFNISHPWKLYTQKKVQMLNYPDGIFPDGKLLDYSFNEIEEPGKMSFDYSFVGGGIIRLESNKVKIIFERSNMDYFEIYNGHFAGRDSVAIEPLTGAINAFNNGIGLKILSPREKMECGFKITVD